MKETRRIITTKKGMAGLFLFMLLFAAVLPVKTFAKAGIETIYYRSTGNLKKEKLTCRNMDLDGDGKADKLVLDVKTRREYVGSILADVIMMDSLDLSINGKRALKYTSSKQNSYFRVITEFTLNLITLQNGHKYIYMLGENEAAISKSIIYSCENGKLRAVFDLTNYFRTSDQSYVSGTVLKVDGNQIIFSVAADETKYFALTEQNKLLKAAAVSSTVKLDTIPQVKISSLTSPKDNQLMLKWKPINSDHISYDIEYSQDKKFKSGVTRVYQEDFRVTKMTDKNVQGGSTYYVRMRACKSYRFDRKYGKWSAVKKIFVKSGATLSLDKSAIAIKQGKSIQLKASVSGTNSKVIWKSRNDEIATVDSSGRVLGKKAGTTVIVAKVSGKSVMCRVTVYQKTLAVRSKALNRYYEYLSQHDKTYKFHLVKADSDSIPELLYGSGDWLGCMDYRNRGYGGNVLYINPTKSLIVTENKIEYGSEYYTCECYVYRKWKQIAKFSYDSTGTYWYYKNESDAGKEVPKSTYDKYLKGATKYTLSSIKYANTESNREAYLK